MVVCQGDSELAAIYDDYDDYDDHNDYDDCSKDDDEDEDYDKEEEEDDDNDANDTFIGKHLHAPLEIDDNERDKNR